MELVEQEDRNVRLADALKDIGERYDMVLVDCPPALDLLTLNALIASNAVLIPMQCEYFALEGISALIDTIEGLRDQGHNPGLHIIGVLLTMFDDRTTLGRQVAGDLRDFFGDLVFETVIPRNVRLAEAPSHGKPVLQYDMRSKGAESYLQLAREMIDRINVSAASQAAP